VVSATASTKTAESTITLLACAMRFAAWLLLLGVVSSSVRAEAPPPDTRVRTVVMGIAPRRGVKDKTLALALSDVLLATYARDTTRLVIGPDDIRRALEWESSRQQAGCDDSKCLAEVGSALDASRIVSGALDAVGNVIIFSLSEIDAKTLEPIARVQEEVSKDEAALLDATRRLSAELLKAAHTAAPKAPRVSSRGTGGLDIGSDPLGAVVVVDGIESGVTPTSVNNLAPGRHVVQLKREGYVTAEVEAPVSDGATAKLRAALPLERRVAEANFAAQPEKWGETELWRQVWGWTKVGGGTLVGGVGLLSAMGAKDAGGRVVLGAAVVASAAVLVWGVADLVTPTPTPVPDWQLQKTATVTPSVGEAEVKVLQEAEAKGG
jgi:hypothetical protein